MSLRTLFMALAVGVVACGGQEDVEDEAAAPDEESALYQYGYRISGNVSGAVASGVTVRLSGAKSATTTTSATGSYSFGGLANGNYSVTPSATGYSFSPQSWAVTVGGANVSGKNFAASVAGATHSISGTVYRVIGTGVVPFAGERMYLSGAASASTTTDASGRYVFSGLLDGTYTVRPFCPRGEGGRGIVYCLPSSWSGVVAGADVSNVNFRIRFFGF
jgi:hypothetical protein